MESAAGVEVWTWVFAFAVTVAVAGEAWTTDEVGTAVSGVGGGVEANVEADEEVCVAAETVEGIGGLLAAVALELLALLVLPALAIALARPGDTGASGSAADLPVDRRRCWLYFCNNFSLLVDTRLVAKSVSLVLAEVV